MQKLCVRAQAGGAAGRSVARRPSGARNAGQPSRWTRRSANKKRWAAIQLMACSMCKALDTKFGAAMGAVNVASAAHILSACLWNRRIQNWPRWYGMHDSVAAAAAEFRVWPHSRRAIKNSAITVIPKRRYGKANWGRRETVRLQERHR